MGAGRGPNIVIVVMDCVRAQNLPIYGYNKPTAPHLTDLARDGLRFDNAIVAAEQTLTSTSALFTGTYPGTHGLFVTGDTLDPNLPTLAEAMRSAGYETTCINCNNPYISPFTGLDRGFDRSITAMPYLRRLWLERPGAQDEAARPDGKSGPVSAVKSSRSKARMRWWLTRLLDGGAKHAFQEARRCLAEPTANPKFVYVHLMETHMYYHPPVGHAHLFLPDMRGRAPWSVNQNPLTLVSGETPMDELDFEIVEGLYNGAIHYTDRLFSRFFEWLRLEGRLRDTVVVLTADHGESFGEHGYLGHGQCVYDTVTRVPLLVWGPVVAQRDRGGVVRSVVQNVDLTASCLDWGGVPEQAMANRIEGVPLPMSPGANAGREFAFSQTVRIFDQRDVELQKSAGVADKAAMAVRSENRKLIWNATEPDELYDLDRDPGETTNVLEVHPREAARMRAAMEEMLARFQKSRQAAVARFRGGDLADVDPLVEQRLRDLGYIA